jgi:Tol biopolymer transport system component
VSFYRALGSGGFSVSANGTLVYLGNRQDFQLVWYDRRGNSTDPGWPKRSYGAVRISPDGQQALVDVYDGRTAEADVWIYDLVRNVPHRFTTELPSDRNAVWSPDMHRVLYTTERGGSPNLFTKALDGSGEIEPMVEHPGPIFSEDWSSDNRWILYTVNSVETGHDLWLKPLSGDMKVKPFLETQADEIGARFSPDGKWLAFTSNETNRTPEVYVAPVEEPGRRRQVSIGGGTTPRWSRSGKELFYAAPDGRSIMSVAIESLAPFKIARPTRLFSVGSVPIARDLMRGVVYDVTPDGRRFLVSQPHGEPTTSRMTTVLNWPASLSR